MQHTIAFSSWLVSICSTCIATGERFTGRWRIGRRWWWRCSRYLYDDELLLAAVVGVVIVDIPAAFLHIRRHSEDVDPTGRAAAVGRGDDIRRHGSFTRRRTGLAARFGGGIRTIAAVLLLHQLHGEFFVHQRDNLWRWKWSVKFDWWVSDRCQTLKVNFDAFTDWANGGDNS